MLGFGIMRYDEDVAHLLLFAVREGARRRGIGSALLAWLERVAHVAGVSHFKVEARRENVAARAFYRKNGYSEIEDVPAMYHKTVDGVRMQKLTSRQK